MSRGTPGLFIGLALATTLLLVVIALFAQLTPEGRTLTYGELIWMGLMRTLDPGTMGGDTGSRLFLFSMLAFTISGIFFVGALISILTTGLDGEIERLRKGRSRVIEQNHTVILGWSTQIFSILSELAIANENQRHAVVVVLADRDKVLMEDEIRERLGSLRHLKIVCRTGSPIDPDDLEIINPYEAKAIIVLTPEDSKTPDSQVIKTILALTSRDQERVSPYHIVAEIRNPANLEVAHMIGREQVELIHTDNLLVRLTTQTCRQSGLSVVYTDLLDFSGDEIYFQSEPKLAGQTYAQALLAYEDSAVIGICFQDSKIKLNPPMETLLHSGDQIIAISEDDDTVRLRETPNVEIDATAIRNTPSSSPKAEHTGLLGWNRRAVKIMRELDAYVAPGSRVSVVTDHAQAAQEIQDLLPELHNQTVTLHAGDTTDRLLLENLTKMDIDHLVLLGDLDHLDPQQADARTLITLLHLRDLGDRLGAPFSIVSEMQDVRNRELAEIARADDFIISDKLVSLTLTQVSENKLIALVLDDLFDPDGSEIYLKPAGDYVELDKPINFYTVVEACGRRSATAIGYRVKQEANSAELFYGIHLNPNKSEMFVLSKGDRIIMLAEN
ncbi:MAG: CASTOR/POLLUX-related putative ion channel [Anaerolineales bacterium]